MLAEHLLDPPPLVTHRFALPQMMEAYDVFSRSAESGALKVVLRNER